MFASLSMLYTPPSCQCLMQLALTLHSPIACLIDIVQSHCIQSTPTRALVALQILTVHVYHEPIVLQNLKSFFHSHPCCSSLVAKGSPSAKTNLLVKNAQIQPIIP
jgi:hypothetical protein